MDSAKGILASVGPAELNWKYVGISQLEQSRNSKVV